MLIYRQFKISVTWVIVNSVFTGVFVYLEFTFKHVYTKLTPNIKVFKFRYTFTLKLEINLLI